MREIMLTAGGPVGVSPLTGKRRYLLDERERLLVELPELVRRQEAWPRIRDPIKRRGEEVTVDCAMYSNKQSYFSLARAIDRFNQQCRAAGRRDLTIEAVSAERR
jgi:hypothetical protein